MPQVVVTLIFFFWPAFQSIRLSVLRVSPFGDRVFFVGFDNYRNLFSSAEYVISVVNTVIFSLGVTALTLIVSLIAALLANQRLRGLTVYRTALLMPYGIAPPVVGVVWLFLFHPAYGIVQYLLSFFGDFRLDWYVSGTVAMVLVILTSAWTHLGYGIAFFLSGIAAHTTRAAGSGGCRRCDAAAEAVLCDAAAPFADHVFPFCDDHDLRALRHVRGHPCNHPGRAGNATETLVYKAYKDGFLGLNMGSSSAQSVVLMILAIFFTWLQFRYTERRVSY